MFFIRTLLFSFAIRICFESIIKVHTKVSTATHLIHFRQIVCLVVLLKKSFGKDMGVHLLEHECLLERKRYI